MTLLYSMQEITKNVHTFYTYAYSYGSVSESVLYFVLKCLENGKLLK